MQIDRLEQALTARLDRLERAHLEPSSVAQAASLSTGAAAQILGLSKSRVAVLAAKDGLGSRYGRIWRLDPAKVEQLRRRREG